MLLFLCVIKVINLNIITNENNEKWSYIPDHPYRILIIEGSKSEKTNSLVNLIYEQNDIDKIYLYAKDLSEPWYEYLIKKRKNAGKKHFNDLNAFIECSNTLDDVSENIDEYKQELFIRFKRLNISLAFIAQSCFTVPKDIRLNFF